MSYYALKDFTYFKVVVVIVVVETVYFVVGL